MELGLKYTHDDTTTFSDADDPYWTESESDSEVNADKEKEDKDKEESDEDSDEESEEESDEENDEEENNDESKEESKKKKKILNAHQDEYWKEVKKLFENGSKEIYFKPNENPHMNGSLLSKYFRKDMLLVAPHLNNLGKFLIVNFVVVIVVD